MLPLFLRVVEGPGRAQGNQQLTYLLMDAAPVSSLMNHTTDNRNRDFVIVTRLDLRLSWLEGQPSPRNWMSKPNTNRAGSPKPPLMQIAFPSCVCLVKTGGGRRGGRWLFLQAVVW